MWCDVAWFGVAWLRVTGRVSCQYIPSVTLHTTMDSHTQPHSRRHTHTVTLTPPPHPNSSTSASRVHYWTFTSPTKIFLLVFSYFFSPFLCFYCYPNVFGFAPRFRLCNIKGRSFFYHSSIPFFPEEFRFDLKYFA